MATVALPLSTGTKLRYAAGSVGTGGFATLPGLVLVYYLTDTLGVAALAAGAVVTIARVWDVLIDPVLGTFSDRQHRLRGSRSSLMLLGAVALPVAFVFTFSTPTTLPAPAAALWVGVAYLVSTTAFSCFQVPYIALPGELTTDYHERTVLLSWRIMALTVAILVFGAGGPALRALGSDAATGYAFMSAVAAAVIAVGMLIATTTARPPAPPGRARSLGNGSPAPHTNPAGATPPPLSIGAQYRAGVDALRASRAFRTLLGAFLLQGVAVGCLLTGANYVATWVLRSEAAVTLLFAALIAPALVATVGWSALSKRIGKERGYRIATLLLVVGTASMLGLLWAPGPWVFAPVGLVGIAYAGMQTLPLAMLPDVISHHEQQQHQATPGQRAPQRIAQAGVFSGVWTAGETTGMAFGAALFTVALAIGGYRPNPEALTQPDHAVTWIILSFSALPALLALLSLIPLQRYPLTKASLHDQRTQ